MPKLRCRNEECGEVFFEKSSLAEGGSCIACGGDTEVLGREDIEPPEDADAAASSSTTIAQRRRVARDAAAVLLRKHSVTEIPVPVRAIARREGFTVIDKDADALGSLSARTVDDVIEVRGDEPEVRKRFSIAHELGHCSFGTTHGLGDDSAERDADHFASNLLVPPGHLSAAFRKTRSKAALAEAFEVSKQVIEIAVSRDRLGNLV